MKKDLYNSASMAALAIAVGLTISSPAGAADLGGPTYKPALMPAPATISWNGIYAGVHAGAGQVNVDGCYKCSNYDSAVYFDGLNLEGVLAGGHIGWNWDRGGKMVLGIEGDWSGMDWNDRVNALSSSESAKASVDSIASIRGRLGFVSGERRQAMVYATAGAAWINADATVYSTSVGDANNPSERRNLDVGDDVAPVVGMGFEYAMTKSLRFGVEGLYYFLDDSKNLRGNNGTFVSEANSGDKLGGDDAMAVRARLSWYFNG